MKADACFKLLGKKLRFSVNDEEKQGRLVQIRLAPNERMLVGIDENGFIEEYEIADVRVIQNNKEQESLMKQIIKQVNKDINTFKFDLGIYRKDELLSIVQKIEDEYLSNQIHESFSVGAYTESYEELYQKISRLELPEEEKDLLYGVIAYKQHDLNMAYKIFSRRWLEARQDPDKCRDFILVADEFDNNVLCFFLLNEFFKANGRYIGDKYYINLWWKYIYYAVKYNNFNLLCNVDVTEWNVRYILDSFIYIFHMYNMKHISIELTNQFTEGNHTILQRNNEDLGNIQETIDKINLLKNYLPDTVEGYYLRFESCIKRIIEAYEKGQTDFVEDEKSGYIYEYVKSRNYGFIIGYDFQEYFYHGDFLPQKIKKRIMDNIYSGKDIDEEDKIYVQFKPEISNKKIQAMEII